MRDYILLYINGKRHEIRGRDAFLPCSEYLRYQQRLTGTKIVCAEGDCGACTVLWGPPFRPINSCIQFIYLWDASHIITVEGISKDDQLNPIQQAMIDHFGAQCGFCTPGFICAMAGLFEEKKEITEKKIRNALTGNLCRCTGYKPIIEAALSLDIESYEKLETRYHHSKISEEIEHHKKIPVSIEWEDKKIYIPNSLQDLILFKASHPQTYLVSGATDLGVQINKKKIAPKIHLSLNHLDELYSISEEKNFIRVGAKVSITRLLQFIENKISEFHRLLNVFASPQIKNVATLAGNIANGSPIGDTLPFLFVVDAEIEITGAQGARQVNINSFYKGYRTTDLGPDEVITAIFIPVPDNDRFLKLYKISKRKDLDISAFTAAFYGKILNGKIEAIKVAFGGVAPTVLRIPQLEQVLNGQPFHLTTFKKAKKIIREVIEPISDVRGSQEYRYLLAENILEKLYYDLTQETHA